MIVYSDNWGIVGAAPYGCHPNLRREAIIFIILHRIG